MGTNSYWVLFFPIALDAQETDAAGDTLQTVADDAKRLAEDARKAAERSSERLAESVERGAKRLRVRT